MPQSNVVITGTSVVSSIGIGDDEFFQALLNGESGVRFLTERTDDGPMPGADFTPAGLSIGAPILDFDPKQYVKPRKALKVMCREIQTAFAASQLAAENAGLGEDLPAEAGGRLQPQDIGTVFGSEMFYGPSLEMEDAIRACMDSQGVVNAGMFGNAALKNIMPLLMLKYLPNMPACHVGIAMNAHGPNNTQVLGDVSAPAALIEAASCIERGLAKVMITGASGTRISTTRLNYRGDLPIPDIYDPVEHSARPHDPESLGTVGGEGAASLVLENASFAKMRDHAPIARIASYASRFSPSHSMTRGRSTDLQPIDLRGSANSIQLAIKAAIEDGNIQASDIGLVISHAMGDPSMDFAEATAIESLLPNCPVTAPMASIGHTGAASGGFGLAVGVQAIQNDTIPPTIRVATTSPAIAFTSKPQKLQGNYVLCLSHTSEGAAWAILLGRAQETP